ncbi:MAG TPA: hypothetical protein VFK05_18700 [Polyangiaceae bacterium]|nr:hypothetical protein [Polyangiaceae bacterium]
MSVTRRIKKLWARLTTRLVIPDGGKPGALHLLYQGVALAPRLVLHVASLAAIAGFFSACVPATQYEEAKSASEVELAARQRAELELSATRSKLEAALAELNQREQKLAETEQSVSESKLESSVAVKERDEANGLVDQLRGELSRVGENLKSYAEQKAELEKNLQAAQARKQELERNEAQTVAIARLTRDLTSALGERVTRGDMAIDVRDGRVLLSAPAELWFNDDGTLRAGMDGALSAVSRVLSLHSASTLELGLPASDADKRGPALLSALSSRGVAASRMKLGAVAPRASSSDPSPRAPAVELWFRVGGAGVQPSFGAS